MKNKELKRKISYLELELIFWKKAALSWRKENKLLKNALIEHKLYLPKIVDDLEEELKEKLKEIFNEKDNNIQKGGKHV